MKKLRVMALMDIDLVPPDDMQGYSDEEWQILAEAVTADNEERSDTAPEGETSTEKQDES